MYIEEVCVTNLRSFKKKKISFKEGINILYGPNGSGKTTFLEAISLLSLGRSFKTNKATDYISREESFYNISGKTNNNTKVEIKGQKNKKAVFVNSEIIKKISDHIYFLPTIINTPDETVLEGKNNFNRNKNINKNIILIEPKMLKTIKDFSTILKQRNSSIKQREDFFIWNPQLIETSKKIWDQKNIYEQKINNEIIKITQKHNINKETKIKIKGITENKKDIESLLYKSKEKDIFKNTTTVGPHKDKIEYLLNGDEIKNKASQGERSVFFSILKKAESMLINKDSKKEPIVLLDDILSKLDNNNTSLVLDIFKNNKQTIITHTEKINFPNVNQIKIDE
ncbi:MAG: hypothetical protein CMG13_04580 [Candidatus Marinimicrobia bacterium]|nr:hypothetical protein [Candidatus Neomarinimicrobiota bacterium]